MSKLNEALQLVTEWFNYAYREFDEDGDAYYTCSSKEWGRYRKIVDNLKAFGAVAPTNTTEEK